MGSGYTKLAVVIVLGKRPATFRTRKLSPTTPMVLHPTGCGRVGNRRNHTTNKGVGGRAFGRREHACVPSLPLLHPPPPFHTHNPEHTHNNPCKWCTRHGNTQPGASPDYYCKDAQPHPTHTEHNASKKTQNTAPARRTQMLLMARNCQLHKQRWRNPFDIRLQIIIPLRQANAH